MISPLPLSQYLSKKLSRYQVIIPMIAALFFAVIIAIAAFGFSVRTNQHFLKLISPHISTLLETGDRPELSRFLTSIAKEEYMNILVVHDELVSASSDNITSIGREYQKNKMWSETSLKQKLSSSMGDKDFNAYIVLNSPILKNWKAIILFFLTVFLLSYAILKFIISKLIETTQNSLEPIKKLNEIILNLKEFQNIPDDFESQVVEINNVFASLKQANAEIIQSNFQLAETKAKELNVIAYKRLIHDLHTPITSLKQMVKVSNRKNINEDQKEYAKTKIAEIAEQILWQIKSSKNFLKVEVNQKDEDIVHSIRSATIQAQLAMPEHENIEVVEDYDPNLLNFKHDAIMLGRAISNLVVNAIEAGQRIVKVSARKTINGLSICISDDGIGMKEDEVSLHLQGRGKSSKKNGTGIGLSSANHIVRLYGGRITLKKSEFGGACFDICMERHS